MCESLCVFVCVCVVTACRPLTFPCTDSLPRERGTEGGGSGSAAEWGCGGLFF